MARRHYIDQSQEVRPGRPPKINIKAEIGFLNEKVPLTFSRKPIYVCFVAERSDGHLLEFRRLRLVQLILAAIVSLADYKQC